MKKIISLLFAAIACAYGIQATAQTSSSTLYVPLIGITAVPEPLALPEGAGDVTYHYAVKNFLREMPLTDIRVVDDTCPTITFTEGDDNNNDELEYSETWRYSCTASITTTTQNTATATGIADSITATHKAYATVVVGSRDPAPLVSIINITKVAYPLSLPVEGGSTTFVYKVNNPGVVPLSDVVVTDNKCSAMSAKVGDTNGNNLLDVNEVWIYTCTATLTQTTTNTAHVTAFAHGFKARGDATITVKVAEPASEATAGFPDTGQSPDIKGTIWKVLVGTIVVLLIVLMLSRKKSKQQP